jgi:mono/diheme cytochrome c family protein
MKKIIYILVIASLTLVACKNENKEESKEETQMEEHNEGMEMEHKEGMEMGDMDHDDGEEGEHSHDAGEHMTHMMEVKAWLQKELGDSYDDVVPPPTEEQLAMGKKTYNTICAACHGVTGKGDGPAAAGLESKPADFTDFSHSAYYSDKGRIHIIKNGVKGTAMVGWSGSLSEEEIQAVYGYCRSLRVHEDDKDLGAGMYTCSMHPEISGNKGEKCPKCGMTLVAKKQEDHNADGHVH